jgi:hypothetical protein
MSKKKQDEDTPVNLKHFLKSYRQTQVQEEEDAFLDDVEEGLLDEDCDRRLENVY